MGEALHIGAGAVGGQIEPAHFAIVAVGHIEVAARIRRAGDGSEEFPFTVLKGGANVLIFPDLDSGNIAYKLLQRLTDATVIGPILLGMKKPVHVLQRGDTVNDIINITAIAVVGAKDHK